MSKFGLISLDMRMATDEDKDLPAYDHTKLSAVNTCPTWGILRYILHKRMPNSTRAMALEAGSASHEGFAAVRLYSTRHFKLKARHNGITWSSTVIVCLGKIGIPVYTMSYPKEPPIEPTLSTLPSKPLSPVDSTTTSQTDDVLSAILKRHS